MLNWYQENQRELNKNKMNYPQDFIDICLKTYPDDEEVKEFLETKSFLLGNYIRKSIPAKITEEEIAAACKAGNFSEVARKNRIRIERTEIYKKFFALYEEQWLSKGRYISRGLDRSSLEVKEEYQIRHGLLEKGIVKEDQVASRIRQDALAYRLEQNEERRRAGEEIAKNRHCGGFFI